MDEKRIAWAITGAGHELEECIHLLLSCRGVDLFLSRAAEEVIRMYGLHTLFAQPGMRIYRESEGDIALLARFLSGSYAVLVIAPATSNSVAKFVCGISDNLVTNLFAQAGKWRLPIIVYPTDLAAEVDSLDPRRRRIKIFPRAIDLENTQKLRKLAGVQVVSNREELKLCLAAYL